MFSLQDFCDFNFITAFGFFIFTLADYLLMLKYCRQESDTNSKDII